jgi:hypothetical protein
MVNKAFKNKDIFEIGKNKAIKSSKIFLTKQ